ncbi:hypothetical protein BDP81DRAFT_432149 [Colletotrichum phormii]|uniref:Secreted protein n=1 Tax=Colletotrichum phormii TaxID=359342 RepID=A0AAI9ZMS1_9PEZI|nr:uncharacterized protein BDP81DRAFT_432149 [Colletotrichum phormii]KAK1634872.1 hypothetical protein BDP81DRAFT_432149 [Colletotrichum phormii]
MLADKLSSVTLFCLISWFFSPVRDLDTVYNLGSLPCPCNFPPLRGGTLTVKRRLSKKCLIPILSTFPIPPKIRTQSIPITAGRVDVADW